MSDLASAETNTGLPVWPAENLTLLLAERSGIVEEIDYTERRSLTGRSPGG